MITGSTRADPTANEISEIASASIARPLVSIIISLKDCGRLRISERVAFAEHFKGEAGAHSKDVEVIIVDATQDNGTKKFVEEKVNSFGGMYVNYKDNEKYYSLAHSRNIGASSAHGKYLLFSDVDLIPPKNFISDLIKFLKNGRIKKAENYFSVIPVFYLNDEIPPEQVGQIRSYQLVDWMNGDASALAANLQMVNSTVLLHRSFYTLLGGQHGDFRGWGMEDWHFLWKLMCFPQPVPGLATDTPFHRNSPKKHNMLESWRDSAWFIGDEAMRNGLYLLHAPHPRRSTGWRKGTYKNQHRFDTLVQERIIFENTPCLKDGANFRVYSEDPVTTNALLYPPNAAVRISDTQDLQKKSNWANIDTRERIVIGGTRLDQEFFQHANMLANAGQTFDFIYPTGIPRCIFYFTFQEGRVLSPTASSTPVQKDWLKARYDETASVAALQFRNSGWRKDKFLPLFILSNDRTEQAETCVKLDAQLGLTAPAFRSLMNALFPLLGPDVAPMVHDISGSDGAGFSVHNAHNVSGQSIDALINAADVVISQSPQFALQAAIEGKPVITTGTLLSEILPDLPVADQLYDVFSFISTMRHAPTSINREKIEAALAHACFYVADRSDAPRAADLLRRTSIDRILFEQVSTPAHQARYDFTNDPGSTSILAWYWPHLNPVEAQNQHLAMLDGQLIQPTDHVIPVTTGSSDTAPGNVLKPRIAADPAERSKMYRKATASSDTTPGNVLNPRFAADPAERSKIYRKATAPSKFSRRLAKLRRNPYRYFADSKVPVLRPLRHFFRAK